MDHMKIKLEDIRIPYRIRTEAEGIPELAKSIEAYGLLQPIIIDERNNLIAGFRRLCAARLLHLDFIEVNVVKVRTRKDALLLEIEENDMRRSFNEEERYRIGLLLKKYEKTSNFEAFLYSIRNFFHRILSFFHQK